LDQRVDAAGADEVGRLGERFNLMTERLAAADRSRKAFVANVSHELRTPVAIIQGHAERLLVREAVPAGGNGRARATASPAAPDEPTTAAALAVIHQETVTLSRLIDDLFTLARLEEATLPVEPAPVCLDEVATEAVDGLRALAWDQRKVTIRSMVQSAVPRALADRTRVRQILNNLLHNALRHTPEGGW
ncbi:MAG: HAMP domain-containing protein, partial [Chloroflexota bacterium]|nr:HAMP domain-containing protein [Chloroflexota bacterium]